MTFLKNDMFKLASQIDGVIKISGTTLDAKRRIVENFNPFHYIFGYKLQQRPWLTYGGKYDE